MSEQNESPNGDPLVRSFDPLAAKHLQTPDELTEGLNEPADGTESDADGHIEAEAQARRAGSGTTGVEVEPEADSDMNLLGFDESKK
jgi:hypothetical protein